MKMNPEETSEKKCFDIEPYGNIALICTDSMFTFKKPLILGYSLHYC